MSSNKPKKVIHAASKRRWYQGIYARFVGSIVIILAAVAMVNIFVAADVWMVQSDDFEQRKNWNLAEQIALDLQPHLAQGVEESWVRERLHYHQGFNPTIRLFLLNRHGSIITSTQEERDLRFQVVPIGPLKKANAVTLPSLPLYALDPKAGRPTVFSAAKTICGGKECYLYATLNTEQFNGIREQSGQLYMIQYIATVFGLGFLLAGLLGVTLFLVFSGGFRSMLSVVRSIADGDYSRRISISGNDEIAEISRAINQMAEAVEDSIAALELTDKQRRELVANISHDLRGPLTVIEGFLETILNRGESLSAEERQEFLKRIHRNVLQQKQLTTDLFELSKLEARERQPDVEPFSLLELAYDSAHKYRLEAEAKNQHLRVNTTKDPGAVLADISMVDRVISNLISNAIRYCPDGAEITIELQDQGERVELAVSDTGNGIPAAELPHIFDSFYRVQKDRSRVSGGSGLGLAIVKKMLESLDSEIHVTSTEGEGTRFWFSLAKANRMQVRESQEQEQEQPAVVQ